MENKKNVIKWGSLVFVVLMVVLIIMNSYTIVQGGTVKVGTSFSGKIIMKPYVEGLNWISPLTSFDTYDIRDNKYEVNNLNIPTQDRFNSSVNITVLYNIDGAKAPYIKLHYGNMKEFLDKTMRQQLRAIIRNEGRKLQDSRSLAIADKITLMQSNAKRALIAGLTGTGINVKEVLIQDIKFDPRISAQILATQQRIQKEQQTESQKRIAITQSQIDEQQAIGRSWSITKDAEAKAKAREAAAKAEAYAIRTKAEADSYQVIQAAKAKAQAIEMEAKANIDLAKSLNDKIFKKMQLDNENELYSHSTGQVPETVIGKTDLRAIGVPVATSTAK